MSTGFKQKSGPARPFKRGVNGQVFGELQRSGPKFTGPRSEMYEMASVTCWWALLVPCAVLAPPIIRVAEENPRPAEYWAGVALPAIKQVAAPAFVPIFRAASHALSPRVRGNSQRNDRGLSSKDLGVPAGTPGAI